MELDAGELEQAGWGADELDLDMGGGAADEEGFEGERRGCQGGGSTAYATTTCAVLHYRRCNSRCMQ
jgi:hypothetical protein